MTILTRWMLWLVFLATTGWLWHVGALGDGIALAVGMASLLVFAWPAHSHRRRRSELRYIEMGKQPVGLP